ncbi:MAG: ABC transporter permease [Chloroflexi bacterium]|nr:MAG: ABC transporter permease [Chloroflexota bacterium]
MLAFVLRRSMWMLVVLFAVSIVTFFLLRAVPGGPFNTERGLPPGVLENLEAKYGLDDPPLIQYVNYIVDITIPRLTDGSFRRSFSEDYLINIDLPFGDERALRWMNFGPSLRQRSRTVNSIFQDNLPISIELGFAALAVALAIGIPLGVIAALKRNSWFDYSSMGVAILGVSVPTIVLAPILQWIFGVELKILPVSGWGSPEQAIMPSFALGFAQSALIARLTRASLLQIMHEDYIRTARAKGLSERVVVAKHALKNAMIPVVTILGPLAAALLTGTFVTEVIFGIPGMGKFFVQSITNRDYTVVMGTVLMYAVFLVLANLLVDITYAWIDPRIRYD